MIVYESKLFKLPFIRNYIGITLTSRLVLFAGSKEEVSKYLEDHELGHEVEFALVDSVAIPGAWDGIVTLWVTYLFSYIYLLIKTRSHWQAYKGIVWERLAREFSDATV